MFGASSEYQGPDKWEAALSWRYQKSDRHFTGAHEDKGRATEHSEVINRVHQPELTITRNYTKRSSLSVGIPYLMAERSNAIRDPDPAGNGEVIARTITTARGVGDITAVLHYLLFDPAKTAKHNIRVGLGAKFPTGQNNVQDTRQRAVFDPVGGTTTFVNEVRTVDQSIQPGDGGFGVIVDVNGYLRFARDRLAAYIEGVYLLNPQDTNGVATYRGGAGEEIMSIADQYLARGGMAWFPGRGFGLSLGMRLEGIPTYDFIGNSNGFRRPGYAFSVDPGVTWTKGARTLSLNVPYAIRRNRLRNTADIENGGHGDAAFADYVLLAGYLQRF